MKREAVIELAWPYRLAVFLVVAAAFLLAHPYTGIRHDGALYAGDALARLMPGQFSDDLYFFYGSQGRFTLLPALYAALIAGFGVGTGTIVGLLLAFSLYLCSAWFLVGSFTDDRYRGLCVLAVALGWGLYGGHRVFGYSEPFLTARSFAEPAVLFGLGLLMRGRIAFAGLALILALLVHPLIGVAGWFVTWVFLVRRDGRWWGLALVAVIVLAAVGLVGAGPFADVFARYDPEWLALVHEANGHAFVLRWSLLDYGIVVFDATVLVFAARTASHQGMRDLAIAAVVAGLVAIGISLVLVDLVGNTFFGKLQVWRVEWVMQWTAMAMLPLVLKTLWDRPGELGRITACFLALGWIAPYTAAPAILAVMAIALESIRARTIVSRTTTRLVLAATIASGLAVATQHESHVVKFGVLLDHPLALIIGQFLALNLLVLVIAMGAIAALPRLGRSAPFAALALVVAALFFWDQRGAWARKLESYPTGTHIWPGLIEPAAKVYWYRDLIAPWILLGHANYYTQQQGSGAVFSRDMTVELDRRRKVTALLDFQEQICRMMNNLSEQPGSCEPDTEAVKSVCADGNLDYVVLQSSLEKKVALAEYSTGVVENGYEKKFFLYRCATLKQG